MIMSTFAIFNRSKMLELFEYLSLASDLNGLICVPGRSTNLKNLKMKAFKAGKRIKGDNSGAK